MIYFTSDTHYNHANVLGYCSRPFSSVDEMNEAMAAKWNARVTARDTVYHLGDFALGPRDKAAEWCAKLNGEKILIAGNHDRKPAHMLAMGFAEVHRELTFLHEDLKILLRHAPLPGNPWAPETRERGELPEGFGLLLHGHVHTRWRRRGPLINVGVDMNQFEPKTIEELLALPEDQVAP